MGVRQINELRFPFGATTHSAYAAGQIQTMTMRLDQGLPRKLIDLSTLSNCIDRSVGALARKKLAGAPEEVEWCDWL